MNIVIISLRPFLHPDIQFFTIFKSARAHPLPVVGGQMSDLVLGDELLQDLGNIVEVGFILLKLHPVDQRCQLVHLLL